MDLRVKYMSPELGIPELFTVLIDRAPVDLGPVMKRKMLDLRTRLAPDAEDAEYAEKIAAEGERAAVESVHNLSLNAPQVSLRLRLINTQSLEYIWIFCHRNSFTHHHCIPYYMAFSQKVLLCIRKYYSFGCVHSVHEIK